LPHLYRKLVKLEVCLVIWELIWSVNFKMSRYKNVKIVSALNQLDTASWRRMGIGYTDPRILDLGTSYMWAVSFMPCCFTSGKRVRGTHQIGCCVVSEPVGKTWRRQNCWSTGIRTPTPWSSSPLPFAVLTACRTEYLHRSPVSRKRWRKGNARRYRWVTILLGDVNTGTWPSRLGSQKNLNNKIGSWVPLDTDP
jgi:hypothetical protein